MSSNNINAIVGETEIERSVGISTFISLHTGFTGILKQRFNDFVVREIDTKGNITHIVSTDGDELENKHFKMASMGVEDIDSMLDTLSKFDLVDFSHSVEELKDYITKCINKSEDCPATFLLCGCDDKEQRSAVHQALKGSFAAYIDTDTVSGIPDSKCNSHVRLLSKHLVKKVKNERNNGKNDRRGTKKNKANNNDNTTDVTPLRQRHWPQGLGNYLSFTFAKENVDTLSAINIIAKNLHMKPDNIGYAGTKDKRAVTFQKCTVYRRKPKDVATLNNINRTPIIRLGDFQYVDEPIRLGELQGNHFDIVLRDINYLPQNSDSADESKSHAAAIDANIEEKMKKLQMLLDDGCLALKKYGFINYFGLQRFGKGVTKSHIIGKEMIRSDWQACVNAFFVPIDGVSTSDLNSSEMSAISAAYCRNDYRAAVEACSYRMHAEKRILESLVNKPNEPYLAFHSIPRNIRLLCVHAYQSYLWNTVVSRRIEVYGKEVVIGDCVLVQGEDTLNAMNASLEDNVENITENTTSASTANVAVHIVNEADVTACTYSLKDVVVPILGKNIEIPELLKPFYEELLAKDGLDVDCFNSQAKGSKINAQYEMAGMYRKMVQNPSDFEYHIKKYSDMNEELYATEFTALHPNHRSNVSKDATNSVDVPTSDAVVEGNSNESQPTPARYIGLHVGFSLPPGTYATMMLRELMKCGTETLFHAKLTAATASGSTNAGESKSVTDQPNSDPVQVKEEGVETEEHVSKKPRMGN